MLALRLINNVAFNGVGMHACMHVSCSSVCTNGILSRGGMSRYSVQDAGNGANSTKACSGMQRCCCKWGSVCFFWCKDISQQQQTQICHSKTDAVHSYFLARVVCIPVHYSLMDVEDEGQLCIRSFVRLFIHSFIGGYAAS